MTQSSVPITVADFEALARDRIEPGAWDYYAGGAGDEHTLRDNREVWNPCACAPESSLTCLLYTSPSPRDS